MKIKKLFHLMFLLAISLVVIPGEVLAGNQTSSISPSSSFILYHRDNYTTWLKEADGDSMILNGLHPRLSPDGVYIITRKGDPLNSDLYRYNLDTQQEIMIFDNKNDYIVGFAWSADGNRIYYDYGCKIFTINMDGSAQQLILDYWPSNPDTGTGCYNDSPDVNPVDGRIAWHNQFHGIGVAMGDGQNPHWINSTAPEDWNPRWSHDGAWIAFQRAGNLYKIHPDNTNLTQLTFREDPDLITWWGGAWEESGNWIISTAKTNGIYHLYAIATDGSGKMVQLFTEPGANPTYVGDVGSWVFNFSYRFLPLVGR